MPLFKDAKETTRNTIEVGSMVDATNHSYHQTAKKNVAANGNGTNCTVENMS